MKAIKTKYLGATNTRPSRYVATAEGGNRITLSTDSELTADENHRTAAMALCKKMAWPGNLASGGFSDHDVHVFAPDISSELLALVTACLPDLKHYASTHGTGPDVRLAALQAALAKARL